jgi:hypothetical protein
MQSQDELEPLSLISSCKETIDQKKDLQSSRSVLVEFKSIQREGMYVLTEIVWIKIV